MSKKILTDDLVYEKMEQDNIKDELRGEEARAFMLEEWDAVFNTDSDWADGHEELIIYTETTSDGYEVYVCTNNHQGKININEDLYYYNDPEAFMERSLDALRHGGEVWIDTYIAEDMDTDIHDAFETAYREYYEEKFEEYQNELINDGYELEEK